MGAVQVADELQQVIERQVVEGRAASAAAFIEEAVLRLVDDARLEDEDIDYAVQAGIADIKAGRYTTVADTEDSEHLGERMMARLRASLSDSE